MLLVLVREVMNELLVRNKNYIKINEWKPAVKVYIYFKNILDPHINNS